MGQIIILLPYQEWQAKTDGSAAAMATKLSYGGCMEIIVKGGIQKWASL
jgi:hypothetical protein